MTKVIYEHCFKEHITQIAILQGKIRYLPVLLQNLIYLIEY